MMNFFPMGYNEVMMLAYFLDCKKINYEMSISDGRYYITCELNDEIKLEYKQFIRRRKIERILNEE